MCWSASKIGASRNGALVTSLPYVVRMVAAAVPGAP
jgi:hypothetical protein